ncbi:MAG: TRAP transporter small permease subunit [Pseudomonadales bacterium]|nr:TRAP transporter small permease subunit [Pseudomonadales bacterium]
MLKTITYRLDKLADITGLLIAPLAQLMMLITCVVVVLRYFLDIGSTQLQETVLYLHGIIIMFGISYTLKRSGHVRVDIIYQKISPAQKAFVNLFGSLIFLIPMAVFIGWSSLDYIALSWSLKEQSAAPDGLPFVYLLKTLIPIMAVLLLLQGIAEIARNLSILLAPHTLHKG